MNILNTIAEKTKERIADEKKFLPLNILRAQAESTSQKLPAFAFEQCLRKPGLQFICEIKKASPSKGIIAEDFPYLKIAREYEEAGAAAVSCLTEPFWFLGSDKFLKEITSEISIPILKKDFTVDEYMIYQAKVNGASAVLLICSILDDSQLKAFQQLSEELGLSVLVEAHTENEIYRALNCGAKILGINNRNLKNFQVDVTNSLKLRKLVPPEVVFVSESGVTNSEDTKKLYENGTDAVLIGETLMRSSNIKQTLKQLKEIE